MANARFEELKAELWDEISPAALRFEQAEILLIDYLIFCEASKQEKESCYRKLGPFDPFYNVTFDFVDSPTVTMIMPSSEIFHIPSQYDSAYSYSISTAPVNGSSSTDVSYAPEE